MPKIEVDKDFILKVAEQITKVNERLNAVERVMKNIHARQDFITAQHAEQPHQESPLVNIHVHK